MYAKKQIGLLVESDANKDKIGTISIATTNKDANHVQRRQQQRAINNAMIQVALMYGRRRFNKGAMIFTLCDRTLHQTPYAKFTDVLRGLTVVCQQAPSHPKILTTYWHKEIRRRVRK